MWSKVLFTDETRISLRRNDRAKRVWREPGEAMNRECLEGVEAFDVGVMVWGGISTEGRTELVIIRGGLTGQRYVNEVLQLQVRPYHAAIGQDFILMDDNAPPHRAAVTDAYLEGEAIERMDWPARSPDLNPLENLWAHLKIQVSRHVQRNTTVADLEQIIVRQWNRTDQNYISNLIHSMRHRCIATIRAEGGPTKY